MLVAVTAMPARAQLIGDRTQANCSSVNRADVTNSTIQVICGMPPEQVVEMVRLAASPNAADHDMLIARLNAVLPANSRFPAEAVARFLQILHEQPVEETKLADRFAQIAEEHVRLLAEVRAFRVNDPEVQALRDAAVAALQGVPNHDLARAKLEEARQLVRAKRQAVAKVLADQQREEATLVREQAGVEASRLRSADAARLYEQAAGLLPPEDHDQRGADLVSACLRWTDQGDARGDNQALTTAIKDCRAALEENTRDRVPLEWATTQMNLGTALWTLGSRESGTQHVTEAVAAYRAALEELTRDRVPLEWATTQMNLGNALKTLGERESGTQHLTEAVAAYRAALEENTRDRVPLEWAYTQHGLAITLAVLAQREKNAKRMREAITCMRAAAEAYEKVGETYWLPKARQSLAEMNAELSQMR
jgi:tetratricopeptide (TPR) repeat protein